MAGSTPTTEGNHRLIIRQIPVGAEAVFCYIIGCPTTKRAAVIDPGGEVEQILTVLRQEGLSTDYIINTHCHPDHTCGNGPLQTATGARIVMHAADAALLREPAAGAYYAKLGFEATPPADRLVKDGDALELGQMTIDIIHVPGHTPGGICLLCGDHLFTGDSLFVGAAGRVDLPGGDFNTLITALAENIATLPDHTIIHPGHHYGDTPTSTIGREKKENPFLGGEW